MKKWKMAAVVGLCLVVAVLLGIKWYSQQKKATGKELVIAKPDHIKIENWEETIILEKGSKEFEELFENVHRCLANSKEEEGFVKVLLGWLDEEPENSELKMVFYYSDPTVLPEFGFVQGRPKERNTLCFFPLNMNYMLVCKDEGYLEAANLIVYTPDKGFFDVLEQYVTGTIVSELPDGLVAVEPEEGMFSEVVYDVQNDKYIFDERLLKNRDYVYAQKKEEVAEIPEHILADISTENLLELALRLPSLERFYEGEADYSLGMGVVSAIEERPFMAELINREDLPGIVVDWFCNKTKWPKDKMIEGLITYPAVYFALGEEQFAQLDKVVRESLDNEIIGNLMWSLDYDWQGKDIEEFEHENLVRGYGWIWDELPEYLRNDVPEDVRKELENR